MLLTPRINLRIHNHGRMKSLTLNLIIPTVQVNVMSDHQFLHPIMPCEFLDSPEFESSRATTDDKFKVGKKIVCVFTENNIWIYFCREIFNGMCVSSSAWKYSMGCVSLRQRANIKWDVCLFVSVQILNKSSNIARYFDVGFQVRITFRIANCSCL